MMEQNQEPETVDEPILMEEEEEETLTPQVNGQSSLAQWHELCQAVKHALTITPVEDAEAERLERILDNVNSYIDSEFVDMEIPEVDKMKKKMNNIRKSVTSIVTKISKFAPVPFSTIQSLSSSD